MCWATTRVGFGSRALPGRHQRGEGRGQVRRRAGCTHQAWALLSWARARAASRPFCAASSLWGPTASSAPARSCGSPPPSAAPARPAAPASGPCAPCGARAVCGGGWGWVVGAWRAGWWAGGRRMWRRRGAQPLKAQAQDPGAWATGPGPRGLSTRSSQDPGPWATGPGPRGLTTWSSQDPGAWATGPGPRGLSTRSRTLGPGVAPTRRPPPTSGSTACGTAGPRAPPRVPPAAPTAGAPPGAGSSAAPPGAPPAGTGVLHSRRAKQQPLSPPLGAHQLQF